MLILRAVIHNVKTTQIEKNQWPSFRRRLFLNLLHFQNFEIYKRLLSSWDTGAPPGQLGGVHDPSAGGPKNLGNAPGFFLIDLF